MKNRSITLIITALNEENNIKPLISKILLSPKLISYINRIILVDDGSSDRTLLEMKDVQKSSPKIAVLNLEKNCGIGFAFKKALKTVNEGSVLWLPSDGEFDPETLLKIFAKITADHIIISYPENSKEVRPLKRFILSRSFTLLLNFLFGNSIKYYNGITLYPVKLIKNIKVHSNRFSFCSELLLKCLHKGYTYSEVPILLTPRRSGKSKAASFRGTFDVIYNTLKLKVELMGMK